MKRFALLLPVLLIAVAKPLSACSCWPPIFSVERSHVDESDFVAHVKVVKEEKYTGKLQDEYGSVSALKIKIIELFKGSPETQQILEMSNNTSCDMGIREGEEWILFASKHDGELMVGPCFIDRRYRFANGLRYQMYADGPPMLSSLHKMFNRPEPKPKDGLHAEYYKNGQKELEVTYKNGLKQGRFRTWYPDGQLMEEAYYENDTLQGRRQWYTRTGQLDRDEYYVMGKHSQYTRYYRDTAQLKRWGQEVSSEIYLLEMERVYDATGNEVVFRKFSATGLISQETFYHRDSGGRTLIYYHDNGKVSSVMVEDKEGKSISYIEYDENGLPLKR